MNNSPNRQLLPVSFAKTVKVSNTRATKTCVIYTRVSSKEQEDNSSLESQKRNCEEFCRRKGIHVAQYFGGTYESAKQDERKEFKKMLDYARKNQNIDSIVVYSFDRFSRSGANAIYLTSELHKIGISLLAVSQETDVSTPSGKFQKNIFLLFSQFDNDLRKDKTVKGMVENLQKGYWVGVTPFGYDNLHKKERARYHKYVINKDGELLKMAFKWKAEGKLNNVEIVNKLKNMGSTIHYKSFVRILSNPFYCGFITSSLIPGEVITGQHPPLVSIDLFKKANAVVIDEPHKGIPKNGKIDQLPLKSFMKDEVSQSPFTGYQQKGIYYYKTRDKGTCVNVNAKYLNDKFIQELEKLEISVKHSPELAERILVKLHEKFSNELNALTVYKKHATELEIKIHNLHESFIERTIDKEVYLSFKEKFETQLKEIETEIGQCAKISSNLEKTILKGVKLAGNLGQLWIKADFDNKQRIQKLVFPDGMVYHKKNDAVRTTRVNSIFTLIAEQSGVLGKKKSGHLNKNDQNSHLVVLTRIELVSKV